MIYFAIYAPIAVFLFIGAGFQNSNNGQDDLSELVLMCYLWPLVLILSILISPYFLGQWLAKRDW